MSNAVQIRGLAKSYGRREAVSDINLSVEAGQTFGYLGPNGAGKSTTIRCMLGLLRPTRGSIAILGTNVALDLGSILERIGYVPGEFGLWPQMTGRQCLDYLAALHPRQAFRQAELCRRFDLTEADLAKQVRSYSRGMRQKIGIVQAFQHGPQLVVLDEPTEGLDPVMKERFSDLLAEHRTAGGTTFLSSHILSEVQEAADEVAVLKQGRVVRQAPTAELTGDRIRHCTLKLKKPPAAGFALDVLGVSNFDGDGEDPTVMRFDFSGDMQPLIKRLARLGVQEFLSEPETLLEAFFEVYESRDADPEPAPFHVDLGKGPGGP